MSLQIETPLFSLGHITSTPGALAEFVNNTQIPHPYLQKHARGEWGPDIGKEDGRQNDEAVNGGWRIMSAYRLNDGTRIWIITEGDRSVTTVLLPSEY